MTRIRLLLFSITVAFLTLAGCSQTSEVQHATETLDRELQAPVEIPFTLTKWNNIVVEAKLNGTDHAKLMFHTDAGAVVVTQEAAKRFKTLVFDHDATMESWGGKSDSRFCTDNQLQIENFSWDNVTVFEDVHSGHETDGKFGPSQFKGQLVEIDFEKSVLVIHNQLPDNATQFEKFTIDRDSNSFFVHGSIKLNGQNIENEFLVHSGYSGIAMLDDQFVADNPDLKSLPFISESKVKDSMGNVLITKKIIVPTLKFGTMEFNDVPVSIFDGAIGRQKISLIGGDMLKRFDIILDAKNSTVYLRKNHLQDASYFKS